MTRDSHLQATAIGATTADADLRLVGRLASGDMDAAGELYDRHAGKILALARRILRDEGDAEDVVQEVFSQAWRTATRFEPARGSVAGWLLMITRTRAIDRLRARQARPDTTGDVLLETMPGNAVTPSDQAIANEQYARIRQGLGALPAEQRTARRVGEIMRPLTDDLTARPNDSVFDALGKASRNQVGRLAVLDGSRLVGYLSLKDITHVLALRGLSDGAGPGGGAGRRAP